VIPKVLDISEIVFPDLGVRQLEDENAALKSTISVLRARIAELETLADSDTLTPLPNRRFFLREMERAALQVSRYGMSAALLFVDVDSLKSINDSHGHCAGDLALIHIARLLRDQVRGSDVVARIGGDEFGILLEHVDEAAARDKAEALCQVIADNPLVKGVPLSVSIGVAPLDEDHQAVLARADGDMYCAKRAQARSDR